MKFKVYDIDNDAIQTPLRADLRDFVPQILDTTSPEEAAHMWVGDNCETEDRTGELLVVRPNGGREVYKFSYDCQPRVNVRKAQ